jgi:hypothetical protein
MRGEMRGKDVRAIMIDLAQIIELFEGGEGKIRILNLDGTCGRGPV